MISRQKILVVGDLMLDRYWMGSVNRISPEAPVPIIDINLCEDKPGGAANVAKNPSDFGMEVTLVGIIGKDEAADDLKRNISSLDIKFLPIIFLAICRVLTLHGIRLFVRCSRTVYSAQPQKSSFCPLNMAMIVANGLCSFPMKSSGTKKTARPAAQRRWSPCALAISRQCRRIFVIRAFPISGQCCSFGKMARQKSQIWCVAAKHQPLQLNGKWAKWAHDRIREKQAKKSRER